jgi:hypothetical protein
MLVAFSGQLRHEVQTDPRHFGCGSIWRIGHVLSACRFIPHLRTVVAEIAEGLSWALILLG